MWAPTSLPLCTVLGLVLNTMPASPPQQWVVIQKLMSRPSGTQNALPTDTML